MSLSPLEALKIWGDSGFPLPPNHQNVASVYPLLAQLYFALGTWLSPSPAIFGGLAAVLDGLTTYVLLRCLQARNQNLAWAILFAWHPLSIVESGHSGHVDALGLLFLALFLRYARSPLMAGLLLAQTALVKIWPIILGGLFFQKGRRRSLTSFGGMFALGFFWLWREPSHFVGLTTYLEHWEFHGGLYALLRMNFSGVETRWLCLGLGILLGFWLLSRNETETSWESKGLGLILVFLFCSPTVHPWYALWVLPFLVLRPQAPWIYFTLAMACAYAVLPSYLQEGVWQEPLWPRWVTYLPPLAFWALRKKILERSVSTVT